MGRSKVRRGVGGSGEGGCASISTNWHDPGVLRVVPFIIVLGQGGNMATGEGPPELSRGHM